MLAQSKMTYSLKSNQGVKTISLIFCSIIVFTVFQDFLHAQVNTYSFYLSESLLFKIFWLLYLPILSFQSKLITFFDQRLNTHKMIGVGYVLIPSLLHLIIFPLLIWFFSSLLFTHTYSYYQTLSYTLSNDSYLHLLLYTGATFVHFHFKNKTKQFEKESIGTLQKLTFTNGRKYTTINVEEIIYITTAAPYIDIHTSDEHYLYSNTLKWIENNLDTSQFIRVHKSTIINLNKVISYQSRLNGDYDLRLSNNVKVRLSRNYSAAFKRSYSLYSS